MQDILDRRARTTDTIADIDKVWQGTLCSIGWGCTVAELDQWARGLEQSDIDEAIAAIKDNPEVVETGLGVAATYAFCKKFGCLNWLKKNDGPTGSTPVSDLGRGDDEASTLINHPVVTGLDDLPFNRNDLKFTDALSDKDFTKLVKNIRVNGIQDPVIRYVVIDGVSYVVHGNNRVRAARQLDIVDDLEFRRVGFPVDGTNFDNAEDVLDTIGTVRQPRFRGQ